MAQFPITKLNLQAVHLGPNSVLAIWKNTTHQFGRNISFLNNNYI